jgi:hypothetical protein
LVCPFTFEIAFAIFMKTTISMDKAGRLVPPAPKRIREAIGIEGCLVLNRGRGQCRLDHSASAKWWRDGAQARAVGVCRTIAESPKPMGSRWKSACAQHHRPNIGNGGPESAAVVGAKHI